MIEDDMALLRQAGRLLETAACHARDMKNTTATLRAENYEDMALRIATRLALRRAEPQPKASSRTTEAMMRSQTFTELYEAAQYLDELVNVHGLVNSFQIWDGKRHCVFAKQ